MSDESKTPKVPAKQPASEPERRSTLPAAPPERRVTEIDKQRVPMAAKPYRLLALVKQDAVVRVQKEPDDTVMTWPHLLSIEFFAAAMMSIFMIAMGVFINAPLEELANGNVTPAVAKAPWYFVGLQELLVYFDPWIAGVLLPSFITVMDRPDDPKGRVQAGNEWVVAARLEDEGTTALVQPQTIVVVLQETSALEARATIRTSTP